MLPLYTGAAGADATFLLDIVVLTGMSTSTLKGSSTVASTEGPCGGGEGFEELFPVTKDSVATVKSS